MYHCRNILLAKIVLSETIFSFLYYNLDEVFFFFFFFFWYSYKLIYQTNVRIECQIKASMTYMSREGCCKYKENVELPKLTKRFFQINCIVLLRVCSLHKLNFTGNWPKISIGVYQAENVPRFQIKFIRIRFVFVFGIRWKSTEVNREYEPCSRNSS